GSHLQPRAQPFPENVVFVWAVHPRLTACNKKDRSCLDEYDYSSGFVFLAPGSELAGSDSPLLPCPGDHWRNT
ncbi:hypothetical protein CIB84_011592, partial [Bambusicola thoracicus]